MVLKSDQQRIKTLLQEAIPLLCKNGLSYQSEFCIEALIGITLDKNDVFLVNINERVCSADTSATSAFHKDGHKFCAGGDDTESVDLSDSVSEGDGNIKTAHQYRIASERTFHKQTTYARNKLHNRGSSLDSSKNKTFERCYTSTRSSENQRENETEARSDFVDNYNVSVDSNLGSPPHKKQMREVGSDIQAYIKQEPDIFEIIDPSDAELEDDVKDPERFSVPATSEATAVSPAEIYNVYSTGLDILQVPSSVLPSTPGGSNVVSTFESNMLNHTLSLAQTLPELSMTTPPVTNQSTAGYGFASLPSNQSKMVDCANTPASPGHADNYTDYPDGTPGHAANIPADDATNSTMFACHLCIGVFKCQRNLIDHIRGKHLAHETYRCVMCGESFRWRSALSIHRKKSCRFAAYGPVELHQTVVPVTSSESLQRTSQHSLTSMDMSNHTKDMSNHTKGAS